MDQPNESEGFKKQRQIMSLNIRRDRRQMIFKKKRQTYADCDQIPLDLGVGENPNKIKPTIIDPLRFQLIDALIKSNYKDQMFSELSEYLLSNNIDLVHKGIIGIRKIVSRTNFPPVYLLFQKINGKSRIFQRIIELMQNQQYPQLRLQAAWILTNVAAGQPDQIKQLITANTVPMFIQLLKKNQQGVIDQAIWAIGNISGDLATYRDQVIREGGVLAIIDLINNPCTTKTNKVLCAWALANMCRGSPLPQYENVKMAAPAFCTLIKSDILDYENLADCIWALSYLTEGKKVKLAPFIEPGNETVKKLISFITLESRLSIMVPTLRVLGNISTGTTAYTQILLSANILASFQSTIQHNKQIIRREISWVLSNICAGTKDQTEHFLSKNPKLLQKTIKLFLYDSEEVKKQLCYVFANLSFTGDVQKVANLYINERIIEYFCDLLKGQPSVSLIVTVLDTLPMILNFGEKYRQSLSLNYGYNQSVNIFCEQIKAFDQKYRIFQTLQMNQNPQVYQKIVKVLQTFFDVSSEKIDAQDMHER